MGRIKCIDRWQRVLMSVFCFALLVPQFIAPAHAGGADHHATGDPHEAHLTDRRHHVALESRLDPQCHPGVDCHLQAIVMVLTVELPEVDTDQQVFLPQRHRGTGIDHGFDPPPPRNLSWPESFRKKNFAKEQKT